MAKKKNGNKNGKTRDRHSQEEPGGKRLLLLSLVALGVVYGDIGTSPLYAIRECFFGEYGIEPSRANVLGVLSLVLWALILVVSIKYLVFVMRADNNGEGGVLALAALVGYKKRSKRRGLMYIIILGLFGAALLYGDGMITPAISVLSAVEGLNVATGFFQPYILPITIFILVGLFLLQSRGTAGIGIVFGPITLLWLLTIALLGVRQIFLEPHILTAANPLHAVSFFINNGVLGFFVLGAVFLVVTGTEALYADMGHFGKRPIRLTWLVAVLPALLLNYFGQGALLLAHPEAAHNPFYSLAPRWAIYPLVILATLATIIASQAAISGAFSLTFQAIQLGYLPRMRIVHTSPKQIGQIYLPQINWILMLATIALVLGFKTSSRLAAAYGVAVTTTMVITSILFFVVARDRWKWNPFATGLLVFLFLLVDLAFFGANIIKISHGAWFPLAIGVAVYIVMSTWHKGREVLARRFRAKTMSVEKFMEKISSQPPPRVQGTAVFMTGNLKLVPPALMHNLSHNKVLHEKVIFLTIVTQEVPRIGARERAEAKDLGQGIFSVTLNYGFMEDPNVPRALAAAEAKGLDFDPKDASFFLGRERFLARKKKQGMSVWREKIFAFLSRNALGATAFYKIPANQVIEVGAQIKL
ncbi:MAG: potassium transporter Kup [Deltaproteobacteria bacterium]|nr:potassium transporter Kup [Deltaproteobacteria bacterium]